MVATSVSRLLALKDQSLSPKPDLRRKIRGITRGSSVDHESGISMYKLGLILLNINALNDCHNHRYVLREGWDARNSQQVLHRCMNNDSYFESAD